MAIVNCYIIHNLYNERNNRQVKDHYSFLSILQAALVNQTELSFNNITESTTSQASSGGGPSRAQSDHQLVQTEDRRTGNDSKLRRRPRTCKVCSYFSRVSD